MKSAWVLYWFAAAFVVQANAQSSPISFQKLTVQQGLNDGMVNAMTQDEDGYMWFASLGGLNRFDGKQVRRFTHRPGDSNSLRNAVPYALAAGAGHTLWVGYIDGLQMFDSHTGKCQDVQALANRNIADIVMLPGGRILLLSRRKLFCYYPDKHKLGPLVTNAGRQTFELLNKPVYAFLLHRQELLLGTDDGVVGLNLETGRAEIWQLPIGSGAVEQVGTDASGKLWTLNIKANKIWCIDRITGKQSSFDWLLQHPGESRLATMNMMAATGRAEIWIGTTERGLIGYNTLTGKASYHRHEPERSQSLSADIIRQMYQATDGRLWLNTMHGVDYFQPGETLFRQLKPYGSASDPVLARGISEDHNGKLWLTSLLGISCYDPQLGTYHTWRNQNGRPDALYSNSVRASQEDELGRIWIATAKGVNRLIPSTGRMEFLTKADCLPRGFYFSINKDKKGRLWFGTRDNDGFYYYDPADGKVHSVADHAVLKSLAHTGGRYVMEDSRGRFWFGCNGGGVAMYDPAHGQLRRWIYRDNLNDSAITNNLVIDIKEDRDGVVWVSSFGGISGIDLQRNKVRHFTDQNGLKSNIAGSLAVDDKNRLWVGTAAGLLLIDSARKRLRYFTEEDGLPLVEMPEHPALVARNGDIIMPSVNGFIRFNPLRYREQQPAIPCLVAGVTLFNSADSVRTIRPPFSSLTLQPGDNFFSIDLEAINFNNPAQTWYAYKLDGFDKEWRYSQDAKAVYTNVPGGKYKFLYKAGTDRNEWKANTGELAVAIGTVFYKAFWFWLVVAVITASVAYVWYRQKMQKQRQWHLLESKAQALEREKTIVMYESLKQQLSPHFLFNSLTSLAGLIETDQHLAGRFLAGLSRIYRYILQSSDSELVTLKDDLAMMQVYVKLQQTRFDKGLEVITTIHPGDLYKKIPPVTLQNLVENAIKHNIMDEDAPLVVRIETDGEYLSVSNNLQKKNVVETSNKRGLSSLRDLYGYLSDKPLHIEETKQTFTIQLPLIS